MMSEAHIFRSLLCACAWKKVSVSFYLTLLNLYYRKMFTIGRDRNTLLSLTSVSDLPPVWVWKSSTLIPRMDEAFYDRLCWRRGAADYSKIKQTIKNNYYEIYSVVTCITFYILVHLVNIAIWVYRSCLEYRSSCLSFSTFDDSFKLVRIYVERLEVHLYF